MKAIEKLRYIKRNLDQLDPGDVPLAFLTRLNRDQIAYNLLVILEGKGKGRVEMVIKGRDPYRFPIDCARFVKDLFMLDRVRAYIYYPWWTGAKFLDILLRNEKGEYPVFLRLGIHSDSEALPPLDMIYRIAKTKSEG